ncbi:MAG: DUF3696 domain-containing protein [Hydrogenophaga sp.]|uniref:DUF3696 domain-containing protein n=1 Tax=Hydrogenophaga sp. TaxID=1904254 RepID=UPI004036D571
MNKKLHSHYQIRWKNFRRFEDTDWITLTPLTILLGSNNSGKSSVISPLLLLAQTMASSDSEAPIVPSGPLIDLGSYKDFVHLHDITRELFFGFRFHVHDRPKERIKPVGAYAPGGVEVTFKAGAHAQEIKLLKYVVTDMFNRPFFARTLNGSQYAVEGALSKKLHAGEKDAIARDTPVNFAFSPTNLLYQLDKQELDGDEESEISGFTPSFSSYLRAAGFTYSYVRGLLNGLSYVGPLRAKLQRYYRFSGELPITVGSQGEHAANLFRRKAKELSGQIDEWVKAFEFGDRLRYHKINDDLFQLLFEAGEEKTNVADAGFGASQVLPLIIQAVAAPEDSLTLAEQPEIHLNPKIQCVLADLFVRMATTGHRVVVETHSEHLIVRLRRLVAEGKIDSSDVSLYFVEKNKGVSTIRKIEIEADGGIELDAWPKGFFDDALRESFALAIAQAEAAKNKPEVDSRISGRSTENTLAPPHGARVNSRAAPKKFARKRIEGK